MLCDNDWIEISWDGKSRRTGVENIRVDLLKQTKTILPFDQACDQVAKDIAAKYDNLFVAFSGGCDTENVVTVFQRNHIPFTVLIVNYEHTTHKDQKFEQWYAKHWCRKNNVTPIEVNVGHMIDTSKDHELYAQYRPRLFTGLSTQQCLLEVADKYNANLVTGMQLEYYPDLDQMTYLESQLGDYKGFVFEESDFYIETMAPNRHPWAFYYWNPDIMASFVAAWNIELNMQENKSAIYNVPLRPKMWYPADFYSGKTWMWRTRFSKKWGTRDCALLGSKEYLLQKLVQIPVDI